jgi:DNA-binding SARP family transcriptional activator
LGDGILEGDDPVSVSGQGLSCDLLEFQGAVEAGKIDHARSLWRGPLLFRMSLPGCRSWEQWVEEKRDGLNRAFFKALVSRAKTLSAGGGTGPALEYLEEALELNPYSVEAHKLRVENFLLLGEVSGARRALDDAIHEIGDDPNIREELDRLGARLTEEEPGTGENSAFSTRVRSSPNDGRTSSRCPAEAEEPSSKPLGLRISPARTGSILPFSFVPTEPSPSS